MKTVPGKLLELLTNARVRVRLDDGREIIAQLPHFRCNREGFYLFEVGQRAEVLMRPPPKIHRIIGMPRPRSE